MQSIDLFGRKARAQLREAEGIYDSKLAEMEERQRLLALRNAAYRIAFLRSAAGAEKLEALTSTLLSENKELLVEVLRLETELQKYTAKRPISSEKMYLSDDEDDLKWQLDQGLIDFSQYEGMLDALGFENTEIQLYDSPADSNFSY